MSEQSALVPLVPTLGNGTAGQSSAAAGQGWDNGGTIGIKALAARVLRAGHARDIGGTTSAKSCPTRPDVTAQDWDKISGLSRSPLEPHDLDERAALVEYGAGVPRTWAEGYAVLAAMPPPTRFLPGRWQRIVDAAGVFIDRWASTAAACGWSDLEIFGCDPDAPDRRFDCMGLVLLLDRVEVIGIDQDGANLITPTGAGQRYRRRPLPPDTVSLWRLANRTVLRRDD